MEDFAQKAGGGVHPRSAIPHATLAACVLRFSPSCSLLWHWHKLSLLQTQSHFTVCKGAAYRSTPALLARGPSPHPKPTSTTATPKLPHTPQAQCGHGTTAAPSAAKSSPRRRRRNTPTSNGSCSAPPPTATLPASSPAQSSSAAPKPPA